MPGSRSASRTLSSSNTETFFPTNDLLDEVRSQIADAEDAFRVPSWFVQQTTWVSDPANSDGADYNYPLLFAVRGQLDFNALQRSLNEIVRRHQVLRSVFRRKGEDLVQAVLPPEEQSLPFVDLLQISEADREKRLQQLCYDEAHRPFDLTRGPLLRRTVLRIEPDYHVLQLTTHHLVHDDWSTGVLLRELIELYSSWANEIKPPLDYLPFQYADYVRWLEGQLREQSECSRLAYWKEQLAGAPRFHHLETDSERSARLTSRGARETIVLPLPLAESLKLLSRRERVSLFMVLLAGFQALLHRYSNDEEIGVASCAANRPLPQLEGLMGRFGNHIFLRTSFARNPTFRELLARMREVALSAYSDQGLPFARILKEASSKLSFQAMFLLQNARREHRDIPGLSIKPFPFYPGTAKNDLTVLLELERDLEITLEYRTDLFRPTTIKEVLVNYRALLQMMADDPAALVSSFVLSPASCAVTEDSTVAEKILPTETAPKFHARARMLEIWSDTFGKTVNLDEDFFQLGGDSLLATRLFTRIEKTFSRRLPVSALLEAPTAGLLADIVSTQPDCKSISLVPIQTLGTKPPLFLCHGHLGEVFYGRDLAKALGPEQPLYGFRSQGLGGEAPLASVEKMAAHYLKEMIDLQKTGPYFLGGWCFGGMIAFEMSRLLRKRGEEVALLLLFNTPVPRSLRGWPLTSGYLRKRIGHELRKLRGLSTKQKLIVFNNKAGGLGRLVSGVIKNALGRFAGSSGAGIGFLSIPDINVAAAKAYSPEPYSGKITLFLTNEARSIYDADPGVGWSRFARGGVELHSVAGDNNTLFNPPYLEKLSEELARCLTKANSAS